MTRNTQRTAAGASVSHVVTCAGLTALLGRRIIADAKRLQRRLLIGIDGPDCSGKTTLCNALVTALKRHHTVLPVHLDDYLNSKRIRQKRGRFAANGFRHDYFDSTALARSVLSPMREGALRREPPQLVIVEGLFLFETELRQFFDLRVRLEIDERTILKRAMCRDAGRLGSPEWVSRHYREQCLPAQRAYRSEARPHKTADFVIQVLSSGRYGVYK